MTKLLKKEIKLSASILSFLFIAFGVMTLLPGYPILVGSFFVCFGVFQSFQRMRENNDIVYSCLLPVAKSDIVKSKFAFTAFIQLCGFLLMTLLTLLRMTVLADSAVYRANALMNANLVYLGYVLLVFSAFQAVFVRGFFRTGYQFSKPFIGFLVTGMLIITIAEVLHHVPGLQVLNSFGFDAIGLQLLCLVAGAVIYIVSFVLSLRDAQRDFEKIDL